MMVITSSVFTSTIIQGMLIAMVSLAVITVLGLVYPALRERDTGPSRASDGGARDGKIRLGSEEMNEYLEEMSAKRKFEEGILFGYRSLRSLLPRLEDFTRSGGLTEFEILDKVLKDSPEIGNVSSLIIQAYRHYEVARFGSQGSPADLDSMKELLMEIYRLNMVLRARAMRGGGE